MLENIPWDNVIALICGMLIMYAVKVNPKGTKKFLRGIANRGKGAGRDESRQEERPPRQDDYDDYYRERPYRDDDRRDYRDDRRPPPPPRRRREPPPQDYPCERCKGSGRIRVTGRMDFSGQATMRCPDCGGSGRTPY